MPQPWQFGDIHYDTVFTFGDKSDRVIETVGRKEGEEKTFELGYYNGDAKQKAIINISPALGCSVGCNFCDLTEPGPLLTARDMLGQVDAMVEMVREIDGVDLRGAPLKINFAKTGEPTFNKDVVPAMRLIAEKYPGTSFKYSTVMPETKQLVERIRELGAFAAGYNAGSVQLTVSLISTDEAHRMASAHPGRLADFKKIRAALDAWQETNPQGRTPNCSLLVGEDTPCDPAHIKDIFPPDRVRVRIRKIVPNEHSEESHIQEASSARIAAIMNAFTASGYRMSDAGIPTPTEAAHGLASNVTRRRMETESFARGIIQAPTLYQLTLPKPENWSQRASSEDQDTGRAGTR